MNNPERIPSPATHPSSSPSNASPAPHIPDDISGLIALPLWTEQDYALFATGDSAAKLADSAVAPLVAAARGYRHISEATAATAKMTGVGGLTGATGSRYKKLVGQAGALWMPWYRPGIARREPTGRPGASANQFRPVEPLFNEKSGQYAKYEFLAGSPTVLDIHPATPGNWLENTPFALITEGILKGDSGLTGMLRAAGITDEELRYDDESVDPLPALRALMKRVPEADRTMIISFGGVGSWHNHPEWNDMNFKHRTVLVAFDGDLETNPNVYKQADALWTKLEHMGASPKLLNLNVVTATTYGADAKKYGLDDYLATVGPWGSLTDRIRDALPPAPAGDGTDDFRAGDVRMNDETYASQVLVEARNEDGSVKKTWKEDKTRLSGRIARTLSLRVATDEEIRLGTLADDTQADAETVVEIEVKWRDQGTVHTATIIGPDTMLPDSTQYWSTSRGGGRVPSNLIMHRDWPAPPEWVSGMKFHRREDTVVTTQWGHMSWVPVEDGAPVFIIGRQVLNRYGPGCKAATPGVTEKALAGSSKFGVRFPESPEEFKRVLLKVWHTYREGVWTDRRIAALVLAAALRPVVPLPCSNAILMSGGKGLGKSWTAAAVMSFYQEIMGSWDNNHLPGSAEDTMAATEIALAKTPIWVIDDWAPVADPRKAAMDSAKLGFIVRAIHNHTGKRRATKDMSSQEVLQPRALLIITAEHEHTVGSVSDRLIHVPIVAGSLGGVQNTERVVQMWKNTGEPSVVTGGAIGYMAEQPDWASSYREWQGNHLSTREDAQKTMSGGKPPAGNQTRHIDMAADLALGLMLWQRLFEQFDLDAEADQAIDAREDLYSLCRDHMISQKDTTPGAALIKALRATLAAGNAHIDSVDTPGAPPISVGPMSGQLNQMLGWRQGPEGARGGGDSIGWLIYPNQAKGGSAANEDPVLLLHPLNAFLTAKKHHPDLIMAGSQPAATWASMWSEDFCSTQWARKKSSTGSLTPVIRKMINSLPIEGVPVRMSALLGLDITEEERSQS